ncbi:MAG: FHA domain-containing protein [Planctomycetota bacterium]|jgi:pSer/pThr/pTyr-binding forkhead associated (FHA) protein
MATESQDLQTFWEANKYLSKSGFAKTHPYPFLVELDPKPQEGDGQDFETLASGGEADRLRFQQTSQIDMASRVFRVVKRGKNSFGNKISVGRSMNNDLVLRHPSVSKFHAYFTVGDVRIEYHITDVNSKNGTLLNNARLTSMKKQEIRNGDMVTFGEDLHFLFLNADDLYSRIRILERFMPPPAP